MKKVCDHKMYWHHTPQSDRSVFNINYDYNSWLLHTTFEDNRMFSAWLLGVLLYYRKIIL